MTETVEVNKSGTLEKRFSVPKNFVNELLFRPPPERPTRTRTKTRAKKHLQVWQN